MVGSRFTNQVVATIVQLHDIVMHNRLGVCAAELHRLYRHGFQDLFKTSACREPFGLMMSFH